MGFFDAVGSYLETREINEARKKAAERNQEAENRKLADAKTAPLGTDAIFGTTTTARPGGGFNRGFTPGSSQAEASKGNVLRQAIANNLAGTTTAPSQGDVNLALQKRDQLNFGRFNEGLNKLISQRQRTSGGIQLPGSQFEGATADAIGRFADTNRANTPVERFTLKSQLDREAAALQGQQLGNLNDRGITPVAGPGNNIAQIIGTQKLTPTPSDLSGAIPFAAAGGFMDDLERQRVAEREDQRYNAFLDVLRQRGDTGNGNMGGSSSVPPNIDSIFPQGQ